MYQSYFMPYGIPVMPYGAMPNMGRGLISGGLGRNIGGLGNIGRMGTIGNLGRSGLGAAVNAGRLGAGATGGIRGLGLLGRLRSISWGSLFNNASRALGVVNQAIPLVKQAGPMMSNMKQVLRVASIFKDETDPVSNRGRKQGKRQRGTVLKGNDSPTSMEPVNRQVLDDVKEDNLELASEASYAPHFFVE